MIFKAPRSFLTNILTITLPTIFLPVLLMVLWLGWRASDDVVDNARLINEQQAIASARALEGILQEPMQYVMWLGLTPQVRGPFDVPGAELNQKRMAGSVATFLNRLPKGIRSVGIYAANGDKIAVACRDQRDWPDKAHDRSWFMGAVSELALTGTAAPIHLTVNPNDPAELIYAMALQRIDNSIAGVAVLSADGHDLARGILGPGRRVITRDGTHVLGSVASNEGAAISASAQVRVPGQPMIQWRWISERNRQEVLTSVRQTRAFLLAASLPALLIGALLIVWVVINMVRPLTHLAQWVRRVQHSSGDTTPITITGPMEIRDITQALVDLRTVVKVREAQLRQNAEHLRIVAEFAADWELWVNADGACQHCSPSVENLTGIPAEQFLQDNELWWNLVDERDRDALREVLSTLSVKDRAVVQWRLAHPDGQERWIEQVVRKVFSRNGEDLGWRATLRDITDRRTLENHLRHSNRVEEIGRLAGGIAHDFNNLLSIIGGYAEILLAGSLDPKVVSSVKQISAAVSRGAGLTKQLLVLSRRQLEQHAIVNLRDVINQVLDLLIPTLGPEYELRGQFLDDGDYTIVCSRGDIDHVLVNLANNAKDAMTHGGVITIELGTDDHQNIRLCVYDDGPGFDDFTLEHIFEPYFTTKEEGRGTGLGLAMAQAIIEGNGGSIRAMNRNDGQQGAIITIHLPRASGQVIADDPVSPIPEQTNAPSHPCAGISVLVVDDNHDICDLVAARLKRDGATVAQAYGGSEALEVATRMQAIDVVVSDVRMPVISGPQLIHLLRQDYPHLPVVFITGDAGDHTHHLADLDQWKIVTKPFRHQDLTEAIAQLVFSR